jgi:hypothetical protein
VAADNLENNNNTKRENDSNLRVKRRPISYNKPTRRQALLEIRRLIVEEGLSHNEIQLRLNLPAATYFRYLDTLFQTEQEAIQGNNYTAQRLWNETLILYQRYLRRARRLEKMADDASISDEVRLQAEIEAGEYERAVHDMTYYAPSYLKIQGLVLPGPKKHDPCLRATRIQMGEDVFGVTEEKDPSEKERLRIAGEIRRENIQRQQNAETNNETQKSL